MPNLLPSLACNLDLDLLAAALPLLEEARVDGLEWSFDALFQTRQVPAWFLDLLTAFGQEKRLVAHGVFFSLFSGKWSEGQRQWLKTLSEASQRYRFDHVTEHFGFMTGQNFHHGAPLAIPYTATTLAIGQDRLARIQEAAQCPVGLENLAFSYSVEDVKRHGEFLEKLIEPVNGFIILDLHNLYCQLHNFSVSFEELIPFYPLERVREIHISGGSWEDSLTTPAKKIRRDTHDNGVPEEVFNLLTQTLPLCPNLKYVVLEQLGNSLKTEQSKTQFYQDYLRMEAIVRDFNATHLNREAELNRFLPSKATFSEELIEDEALYAQQVELSSILETAGSYEEAQQKLQTSKLAHSAWQVEQWEPAMLETAISLAQKWKKK